MTDLELFQMALNALEECYDVQAYPANGETIQDDAIKSLRARLAQPEPEPFEYWNAVEGWVKIDEVRQHFDTAGCGTIYKTGGEDRVPLYTAPPQREWVGLTSDEIRCIIEASEITLKNYCSEDKQIEYARAIETKLRGKNQ